MVANLVESLLRALTNGVHISVGMPLIDGNKLRPKPKTDDGNVCFAPLHERFFSDVYHGPLGDGCDLLIFLLSAAVQTIALCTRVR